VGHGGWVVSGTVPTLLALYYTPIRLPSVIHMRVGGNKYVLTGSVNDKCSLLSDSYAFG